MALESAGSRQSIKNAVHKATAENIARKIYNIGSYEAGKTVVDDVPRISASSAFTGSLYGFGSMLHRDHLQAERGTGGQVEFWNVPQAETGGAAAALGEIDFTGSTGVLAGTLYLYVGFDLVRVSVIAAMTIEELADATVLAINANVDLNVTAVKVAVTFEVTITSKTLGTFGNFNILSVNRGFDQETATGVAVAFTQPTGGTGLPDIQDALDGMGTLDGANGNFATALIHGYGQDSTTLDAISAYVGAGDELLGLYKKIVARPFRSATGDNGDLATGLSDLVVIGAARTSDRANGILPVSGSKSHPSEIGAQYIGHMERITKTEAVVKGYTKTAMIGIDPGDIDDRWTDNETSRNTALNAGIGTTLVEGGTVYIMDAVSFYHPNSIPENSNIYREWVNIPKIQNILNGLKVTFSGPPFVGAGIVQDTAKVGTKIKPHVIDEDIERAVLNTLIDAWVKEGWLYEGDFAKANLDIALRAATDGFDSIIKAILSGLNKVNDNQVLADASTAVLN